MIKRLNWDSGFFGYEIGKIILSSLDDFNFNEFKNNTLSYKLIYVFSQEKIICKQLNLVDTKLTFLKKSAKIKELDENYLTFFNKEKDDFRSLEVLALSSGEYSRFKIDNNFKNGEYERLYKKWIKNIVYDKEALDIIIYKKDNCILGFTTLEKKNDLVCDISLVAVDSKFRGKRIGTKLINYTIEQAFIKGFEKIEVVTQLKNKPAINLYHKCGFEINQTIYIYHYWNL